MLKIVENKKVHKNQSKNQAIAISKIWNQLN